MAQGNTARTKVPRKIPTISVGRGRAAARGGGPVIELGCGITVYPARTRSGWSMTTW
jgi:hypothetical protein